MPCAVQPMGPVGGECADFEARSLRTPLLQSLSAHDANLEIVQISGSCNSYGMIRVVDRQSDRSAEFRLLDVYKLNRCVESFSSLAELEEAIAARREQSGSQTSGVTEETRSRGILITRLDFSSFAEGEASMAVLREMAREDSLSQTARMAASGQTMSESARSPQPPKPTAAKIKAKLARFLYKLADALNADV